MLRKKTRPPSRRIRATVLQPLLTFVAARNRHARTLAAAMQMQCAACGSRLTAHVGPRNHWNGCPAASVKGGTR